MTVWVRAYHSYCQDEHCGVRYIDSEVMKHSWCRWSELRLNLSDIKLNLLRPLSNAVDSSLWLAGDRHTLLDEEVGVSQLKHIYCEFKMVADKCSIDWLTRSPSCSLRFLLVSHQYLEEAKIMQQSSKRNLRLAAGSLQRWTLAWIDSDWVTEWLLSVSSPSSSDSVANDGKGSSTSLRFHPCQYRSPHLKPSRHSSPSSTS